MRTSVLRARSGKTSHHNKDQAATRWWRALVFIVLFLILIGVFARYIQLFLDSRFDGERGPYLQNLNASAVSIHWQSKEHTMGHVEYRQLVDDRPAEKVDSWQSITFSSSKRHRIRLSNLAAGRQYEYQIRQSSGALIGPYRFWTWSTSISTPSESSKSERLTRVWVLGDPGLNSALARQVQLSAQSWLNEQSREQRPLMDLWLTTGDNAYTSGRNREFQSAIFEPYRDWLAQYALIPVYGNHDARRWSFFNIFEFPQQGEMGGVASNSEHFYAIEYGALHIVVLDSQTADFDPDGEMIRWLKKDLAQTKTPWTLALFHHPPYSRGSHDSDDDSGSDWRMRAIREQLLPILENHGVDLILSGHSHAYERSHLIQGHYGMSDDFNSQHVVDAGYREGVVYHYLQEPSCTHQCGSLYVVLGNSAELHAGTMDHPALAVSSTEGGSLVLEADGQCLVGRMLTAQRTVVDEFRIMHTVGGCSKSL